jgi:YHS domain-containing protein
MNRFLTLGAVLVCAGVVWAAEKTYGKCPISGKAAKEEASKDYKGKKVYFCCDGCPGAFDAEKHGTKANHQLAVTGQIKQTGCPYSGGKVKAGTEIDIDGVKVGFCCDNCKGKTEKADDKVTMVFKSIAKGFTLQTKCPVSGKDIDTSVVSEKDGKKVYLCCEGCVAPYENDPAKYADKLPKAD